MAEALSTSAWRQFGQRLGLLPVPARRLLCVVVRQAYHGTLRSKAPGRATMPEIHEACGLDVDELHGLLTVLKDSHFIALEGSYPFEEVQLASEPVGAESIWERVLRRCDCTGTRLECVIVNMQIESMFDS
ncbi:MAG TPA: hypothetical protein VE988_13305 [Gemmataceae bacterium]|nr:hypothetical protein [Gemmataceae bacterium]